ncbi:MAG: hypothetical protein ISS87_01760 [Candidatus Pacebacteria bacterium]|nr:hypothetical protein [Candidatus Paceibacterota bacterium]
MPIQFLAKQERQSIFAVVFVIFIFLTFLVFFLGFFKKKGVNFAPPVTIPPAKRVEINFQILESPIVDGLEMMEEISLPEEKGRENPFLPY